MPGGKIGLGIPNAEYMIPIGDYLAWKGTFSNELDT